MKKHVPILNQIIIDLPTAVVVLMKENPSIDELRNQSEPKNISR